MFYLSLGVVFSDFLAFIFLLALFFFFFFFQI